MLKSGICAAALTAASAACTFAPSITRAEAPAPLSEKEALALGTEAYIFGYPLVTMEMSRRVMTNVAAPEGTRAPMGNVVRLREYPNAKFRDVTAPNADTLYTTAWLDVGAEPWVVSIPDMNDRYFLMPMLDGWTNVFDVPGKRTTGTKAQTWAITGPGWKGTLPAGVTEYKSPTSIVWLLGRIYCTGTPEDYKLVHAIQDKVTVQPLSTWGTTFTPPAGKVDASIDMKKSVRDLVNEMSAEQYFSMLAQLMKENPPAPADAPMIAKLGRLGIVAGQPVNAAAWGADGAKAMTQVPKVGFEKIMGHFKTAGTHENGWVFTTDTGIYGTDYIQRALITAIGLGANRPQDAVYPTSEADAAGKPYEGSSKYVMRFEKGQMPPVNGFWSLTMYDQDFFFVDNPLNRYTVSSRTKFKENADGSVDVYLQNENPGPDKESNWLPAPKGRFIPMLRLYWPKETAPSIIDGTWKIPAVKKAS
ncbi:MAG: DUF1254 domain-containing protein [Planctomycetes bacterium]|nr:DUF1254 domain-containing protein [Planctomycetota bacterium]